MYRNTVAIGMLAVMFTGSVPVLFGTDAQAQSLSKGNGDLRVMTYNIDEGTDYLEVASAQTLSQFLVAVGETITQVRATDPPARMGAVAARILAASPALVSLQEVDFWYTGPFNTSTGQCGAVSVEFNMLADLLGALAAQGGHYAVANSATELAFPPTPGVILSSGTYLCVAVVDFNVILARTDLNASNFSWTNPQSAQFQNEVYLPTPAGTVPIPRSWVSVDATFNGKAFRFIGTHLDSISAVIRELQAGELRTGPANTSLPVIIAMDSNAQAAPLPEDATYLDFMASGYQDAWLEVYPAVPGFTCCQAQFVNNASSQLYQRIDLILTFGGIETQNVALFGATPTPITNTVLWPSDHAGVAAQLVVESQ